MNAWLGGEQGVAYTFDQMIEGSADDGGMTTIPLTDTQDGIGPFYVEPSGKWTKPVVALINMESISSGEGMIRGITRLPEDRAKIVGFSGSNGSFAMANGQVWLPGDMLMYHPFGYTVDADGNIQLDGGTDGVGGILPTAPIPRTAENLNAYARGNLAKELGTEEVDVELSYAKEVLRGLIG